MYKIYLDGRLMYDPRLTDEGYGVASPHLVMGANLASTLTFMIYQNNPEWSNMNKLKSIITVFDDDYLIFRGRILNDIQKWNNEKEVTAESELAFFNDSIVRPYDFTGSVYDYVAFLVNQHNEQVGDDFKFTLRNVTVTDPNDYIIRASSALPDTLSEINEKLIKLLGGYIYLERIDNVTYLDYLTDSPFATTQKIELKKNLLDLESEVLGQDIVTAIIPQGAQLTDDDGQQLDGRLTLDNDDGTDYVFDSDAVEKYGWHFKSTTYDDITTQSALLARAQTELVQASKPTTSLTLTAVDLSMVDRTIDKLRVFEYVEADSAPHGLSGRFLITKLDLDMVSPENNKVTIGANGATLSDPNCGVDKVKMIVNSSKSEQTKYVNERMLSLSANFQVMSDQILSQVSENYVYSDDFTQYQQDIGTQLQQTNNSFNFTFNNVTQSITDLDGETQARFEDLSSWIRFVDGEIQLGQNNSPLSLSIDNDSISFKSNGKEIAYFTNNKLYVTDVEATNSLQLGKFKFLPRENGNLSFLMTED